jgi:hypothetical protein
MPHSVKVSQEAPSCQLPFWILEFWKNDQFMKPYNLRTGLAVGALEASRGILRHVSQESPSSQLPSSILDYS